jgi:hypothetical protein
MKDENAGNRYFSLNFWPKTQTVDIFALRAVTSHVI